MLTLQRLRLNGARSAEGPAKVAARVRGKCLIQAAFPRFTFRGVREARRRVYYDGDTTCPPHPLNEDPLDVCLRAWAIVLAMH